MSNFRHKYLNSGINAPAFFVIGLIFNINTHITSTTDHPSLANIEIIIPVTSLSLNVPS